MNAVTGGALWQWRDRQGWDRRKLARELRRAAARNGIPAAEQDSLKRMVRDWETGDHGPSERYLHLYRALGYGTEPDGTTPGEVAAFITGIRGRIDAIGGPERIEALAAAAAANPGKTAPPAVIDAARDAAITALTEAAARIEELADILRQRGSDE